MVQEELVSNQPSNPSLKRERFVVCSSSLNNHHHQVEIPQWVPPFRPDISDPSATNTQPKQIMKEIMYGFNPKRVVDLEFFTWSGPEAFEYEEKRLQIRKVYDGCLKLLAAIKALEDIPEEVLNDAEQQVEFSEKVLQKMQASVVTLALKNEDCMDKFLDFLVEEWKAPTLSMIVYVLLILAKNQAAKACVKRRHVIRLCNLVMHEKRFEAVCDSAMQLFLFENLSISWTALSCLLDDELRKRKFSMDVKNPDFIFERRCLDYLSSFAKMKGGSFINRLLDVYSRVLDFHSHSSQLNTMIIHDLKEMKVNKKAIFKLVSRVFSSKHAPDEEIVGSFYDYCKATNTEDLIDNPNMLSKKSSEQKTKIRELRKQNKLRILQAIKRDDKTYDPSIDYKNFKTEVEIDPNVYSFSSLKLHLAERIGTISPYDRTLFIKQHYGSLVRAEKAEEKEYEQLAKMTSRVS